MPLMCDLGEEFDQIDSRMYNIFRFCVMKKIATGHKRGSAMAIMDEIGCGGCADTYAERLIAEYPATEAFFKED